ncbi:subtilase-type serine protease [Mesorhizobium soli]|uniref:autotransporter outer membrane beta-barrel domain-containing protein n=1 Tax=Pseudaminobacter soli (ex Li et al. 2025) TaxID=1295366 RepID=UPI002474E81D|nr:autotransporter domain-containing protein [Mesorhizobium soli]MDH6233017.1 subtilase-type serine protease [Mesorhizobium soli]
MFLQFFGFGRQFAGVARQMNRMAVAGHLGTVLPKIAKSALLGTSMLTALSAPAMAQEPWIMVQRTFFPDADPARGQGVTTDGTYWYFSGTHSLEIADGNFNTVKIDKDAIVNELMIPSQLSSIGLNHIGDIDYANGLLYVSLDTSKRDPITNNKYSHPVFAIYNASDLTYTGQAFALNPPHGVRDIASWVAVDAKAGLAYGMAYDNATELAVYNLSDFSFKEYIPLSATIDQAQGGKILDGWMYFATDNDDKLLMRANLKTGQVETLGNLKLDAEQEVEGLSIRWTKDGWSLNVLNREESFPGSLEEGVGFYKYLRPYGNVLSGEIHADISGALLADSRFIREATNRRILAAFDAAAVPTGAVTTFDQKGPSAAPSDTDGVAFWSEAIGASSSAKGVGYAADFDHSSAGLIGGIDAPIGDWRFGVAGGYSHTNFDVSQRASFASSNNYQLGVYGGTQLGGIGLRMGASYGLHDISTERSVVFPAFSEKLSADYKAATTQAYGEMDYRIETGRGVLSPFAGLAYVHLKSDDFSEKGGTIDALSSNGTTSENTFSTIGMRASTPFSFGETNGWLHGQVGWQHAYQDVTTMTNLTLNTGASFDSVGVPIAKDALALEAGFDIALSKQATFRTSYSGQIARKVQDHAIKVSFDLKF